MLRGVFSGGTLGLETLRSLALVLDPLVSNLAVPGVVPVDREGSEPVHRLLDLGADEFTVGRPHPMIDPELVAKGDREMIEDLLPAAINQAIVDGII